MRVLPLAVFLALTLNGCALFTQPESPKPSHDKKPLPPPPTTAQEASPTTPTTPTRRTAEGTEITWERPSNQVDGFVIRYGEEPKRLDKEVKLSVRSLREEQDPEFGSVYRYVIRNTSPVKPLYVSIAAFKGDRLSDFSESKGELRD